MSDRPPTQYFFVAEYEYAAPHVSCDYDTMDALLHTVKTCYGKNTASHNRVTLYSRNDLGIVNQIQTVIDTLKRNCNS